MSLRRWWSRITGQDIDRDECPGDQWEPLIRRHGPPKNHPLCEVCQCYPECRPDCPDHELCRAKTGGTWSKSDDPHYNRALRLHCLVAHLLSNIDDGIRLELQEPVALRWVALLQECVMCTGYGDDFPLPDWFKNAEARINAACAEYAIDGPRSRPRQFVEEEANLRVEPCTDGVMRVWIGFSVQDDIAIPLRDVPELITRLSRITAQRADHAQS